MSTANTDATDAAMIVVTIKNLIAL